VEKYLRNLLFHIIHWTIHKKRKLLERLMELTFDSFGISKIREREPLKALTVHKLRAFNSTVHLELIELTS
jgi:hypothetical protein